MSAEPLSREERAQIAADRAAYREIEADMGHALSDEPAHFMTDERWEATVQAVEAERDALRAEFDGMCELHDAKHRDWRRAEERDDALARRVEALRAALAEIVSPPDASKGENYGCLNMQEARYIAEAALADDDEAAR